MMKKVLTALVSGALFLSGGIVIADSHKDAADQPDPASPVEIFACSYNDGKGPADLDAAVDKWNAWADKQGLDDYSAWTLVPYYAGPEQEFDVIWLGAAPSAKALGRAQDTWLATGGKVQDGGGSEEFDFKYIAAWQNLEDQGADWDQYSAGGYAKAGELFAGKLDCDSSRVYLATNRRMAKDDDE
jgi:hypothetical protein